MRYLLDVKNLKAGIAGKEILKGANLKIESGTIHAIMGQNGSGKSTLANVLMGNPVYSVESGEIIFNGKNVVGWSPDMRARDGMFLAFQYPSEISGLRLQGVMRTAYNEIMKQKNERQLTIFEFQEVFNNKSAMLKMKPELLQRGLNEGFSGGEKKRSEILQMMLLEPKLSILDEIDSGLDVDALKIVAKGVNALKNPERSTIIITHYEKILNYAKPDFVHVMHDGRIIESGDFDLALEIAEKGYDSIVSRALGK